MSLLCLHFSPGHVQLEPFTLSANTIGNVPQHNLSFIIPARLKLLSIIIVMDAPQKRVEFLFVNKDSTLRSARSSEANTAKAINRHVQTTYFRTTSSKRRQHLQESAASVRRIARQGHVFKWRLPKNSSEEQESPKASSKETRPDRPRPSERPSPAKGDRSLELVPQHPFSHPLLSSELVLGKQLYSALQYYRSNSIFRTHETRLKAEGGRHFPVLQRRIVNCLSSEM